MSDKRTTMRDLSSGKGRSIKLYGQSGKINVPRVAHPGSEVWWFVPASVKCVHAIGRTCPEIGSIATQKDVNRLRGEFGTFYEGESFSIVQQLDFIATEILRVDRLFNVSTAHSARKDYLSPRQAYDRSRREMPVPDIEPIVVAMMDPSWSVKQYPIRWTSRPIGPANGDRYAVSTHSPKGVQGEISQ